MLKIVDYFNAITGTLTNEIENSLRITANDSNIVSILQIPFPLLVSLQHSLTRRSKVEFVNILYYIDNNAKK